MVDEEEVYIIKKIISKYDKPFFPPSISTKSHLIFLKYTSPKYRTYMINQYKYLCNKLHNNVNKHEQESKRKELKEIINMKYFICQYYSMI